MRPPINLVSRCIIVFHVFLCIHELNNRYRLSSLWLLRLLCLNQQTSPDELTHFELVEGISICSIVFITIQWRIELQNSTKQQRLKTDKYNICKYSILAQNFRKMLLWGYREKERNIVHPRRYILYLSSFFWTGWKTDGYIMLKYSLFFLRKNVEIFM